MLRNRSANASVIAVLALAIFVSACGKKHPPVVPAPPPPPAPAPVATATPPPPPPPARPPVVPPTPTPAPTEAELFARMSLADLNRQGPLADVFFTYDQADLSDAARTGLQKNADWMKKWTSTRVTVEGHADSRGTSEYNLSLGERRAAAVRDYIVSLGVPAARINIVSMGEEQPQCTEETEACWAKNRRGHFVVTAK
jgi:peptidoglycan-associated lipoprotein